MIKPCNIKHQEKAQESCKKIYISNEKLYIEEIHHIQP